MKEGGRQKYNKCKIVIKCEFERIFIFNDKLSNYKTFQKFTPTNLRKKNCL